MGYLFNAFSRLPFVCDGWDAAVAARPLRESI
jgi:hypothetical protein